MVMSSHAMTCNFMTTYGLQCHSCYQNVNSLSCDECSAPIHRCMHACMHESIYTDSTPCKPVYGREHKSYIRYSTRSCFDILNVRKQIIHSATQAWSRQSQLRFETVLARTMSRYVNDRCPGSYCPCNVLACMYIAHTYCR